MSWTRPGLLAACLALPLASCGSCNKSETAAGAASSSASTSTIAVVPEALPRCRGDAQRLAIPGEDVVVGDVAIGKSGLLVGLVRVEGGERVASVLRTTLDLASSRVVNVGPPLGDDPPPSPRWSGDQAYVAFIARHGSAAGAKVRELRVARLEEAALGKVEGTIVQQADESTAFDAAWGEGGTGLVAWDEDAPTQGKPAGWSESGVPVSFEGRGFVKVQVLGSETRRVASPETSDAEAPRLLARPGGGFWLAWLARRAEDELYAVEGPGEKRAFRWVEVVALAANGDAAGPVRRVSPEKGRAASFELARSGSELVVMVQDEAAPSEGAGARIVRYTVGEKIESSDVVDGGVGTTLAELVPAASPADGARWLAWTDTSERAHMTPLAGGLVAAGRPTTEPSLDGARVLAAASPDGIYALVGASPSEPAAGRAAMHPELRRFVCPAGTNEPGKPESAK
ncbi:MAG: hypothetical protein K0S65_2861 [Labilithrix sp.]|nr:hypothetical protein [Labilithrix sp.]